ncbi:unnamed protein product [Discula destructiva]
MDHVTQFINYIMTPSAPVFIVGGLLVLLMPLLMHLWLTQSATYTTLPSILLVGPSGAGKTALHTLLERRTTPSETHTSQKPSTTELAISVSKSASGTTTTSFRTDLDATGATATKFLVVDTPGHGKLRHHALKRLSATATASHKLKGVVFVVDAAALSEPETLADAAAFLYDVLLRLQKRTGSTRTSKAPPAIPVLVAANKNDLFTALPAKLVKSSLEKELGRIRRTRSKGLLDSGVGSDDVAAGTDEADDWLGEYGSEEFKFDQMREFDIYIDVEGGAVLGDKADVDKWWSWIGKKL